MDRWHELTVKIRIDGGIDRGKTKRVEACAHKPNGEQSDSTLSK